MDERDIYDETIQRFKRTADLVDKHKRGYDIKFLDAVALSKFLEETGDVMELIRLSFDMGFYKGIGYQIDYAKNEENEERKQEEEERRQAEEEKKRAESQVSTKPKRGRRKKVEEE